MQSGFRYAMAEDMKPGAKLYRGDITGAKIEENAITINTLEASYTGTSGNPGKGMFTPDETGVTMLFGTRLPTALFVKEEKPTGSSRKVRKTRRYRRKTDSFKTKS